ncbi:MAG TPA: RES family NAD+ phosphorylase [Thermoleophilaceae bacterium]
MTRQPPPGSYTGTPATTEVPAGTVLSRVHRTAHAACGFNPIASDILFGGGRFDATDDESYGYLYAGESDEAAVAEALLRDVDANDRGYRFLAKRYWRGRQLSRVRTTRPVTVVSLRSGTDLGAIGQDTWLTTCDADDYPQTRNWAHWLRQIVPDAAGIVWISKREPAAEAFVLFEDRCPAGFLTDAFGPLPFPCVFEEDDGCAWLRMTLARYRVTIRC